MQEFDAINRIKDLCHSRSWTYYRLAKESGITYSTLSTMMNKTSSPSIQTLLKICNGFNITLAEFFDESSANATLSKTEKNLLIEWNKLNDLNKQHLEIYIQFLISLQTAD